VGEFLGHKVGFVLQIFDGKKRTTTFRLISETFCGEFEETNQRSEFLSKKCLISKNKSFEMESTKWRYS
jgi:hypothetical protein